MINQEPKEKFEGFPVQNSDYQDLLNSFDISTIFLDRSLRIKGFSPSACDIFDLDSNDRGRSLSEITGKLDSEGLEADCEIVITGLHPVERELKTNDRIDYLMRAVPVRTEEGNVNGVLVTFMDITERKAAVLGLERAHADMEERVRERTHKLQDEIEERKAAEKNVRQLLRRLVNVQEEERKRIARDIHDQMGQELTALRIHLESLRAAANTGELNEQISKALECARDLDRSVDFLTWELRPASLDHLGLAPSFDELVKSWSERFDIPAEFHSASTENLRLPPEAETNLYLFAREALHNVYKHADAQNVAVMFEQREGQVVLVIEDDGMGFDPESVTPADGRGLGIISMHERAALIGGEVEIESTVGEGTAIYVRIPFDPQSEPPA